MLRGAFGQPDLGAQVVPRPARPPLQLAKVDPSPVRAGAGHRANDGDRAQVDRPAVQATPAQRAAGGRRLGQDVGTHDGGQRGPGRCPQLGQELGQGRSARSGRQNPTAARRPVSTPTSSMSALGVRLVATAMASRPPGSAAFTCRTGLARSEVRTVSTRAAPSAASARSWRLLPNTDQPATAKVARPTAVASTATRRSPTEATRHLADGQEGPQARGRPGRAVGGPAGGGEQARPGQRRHQGDQAGHEQRGGPEVALLLVPEGTAQEQQGQPGAGRDERDRLAEHLPAPGPAGGRPAGQLGHAAPQHADPGEEGGDERAGERHPGAGERSGRDLDGGAGQELGRGHQADAGPSGEEAERDGGRQQQQDLEQAEGEDGAGREPAQLGQGDLAGTGRAGVGRRHVEHEPAEPDELSDDEHHRQGEGPAVDGGGTQHVAEEGGDVGVRGLAHRCAAAVGRRPRAARGRLIRRTWAGSRARSTRTRANARDEPARRWRPG